MVDASRNSESEQQVRPAVRIVAWGVLLLVPLLVVVFGGEILLRLTNPQSLAAPMYRPTPWGFGLKPNLDAIRTQSDAGTDYRVSTNALGMRTDGNGADGDGPSVLVIGDSFTFGVGVEDGETFPSRTEQFLTGMFGARVTVWNGGCPGWGTTHALAFWRAQGRSLGPDAVVLAFFRNDLFDNMRGDVYRVDDGEFKKVEQPEMSLARWLTERLPFYEFLCTHSHLVNFLRRMAAAQELRPQPTIPDGSDDLEPDAAESDGKSKKQESGVAVSSRPARLREPLRMYETCLRTFLDEAAQTDTPVYLLYLPGKDDLENSLSIHLTEPMRTGEQLVEVGEAAGLVEVISVLQQERGSGTQLFIEGDGHFSVSGNEVVGMALAEALKPLLTQMIATDSHEIPE